MVINVMHVIFLPLDLVYNIFEVFPYSVDFIFGYLGVFDFIIPVTLFVYCMMYVFAFQWVLLMINLVGWVLDRLPLIGSSNRL